MLQYFAAFDETVNRLGRPKYGFPAIQPDISPDHFSTTFLQEYTSQMYCKTVNCSKEYAVELFLTFLGIPNPVLVNFDYDDIALVFKDPYLMSKHLSKDKLAQLDNIARILIPDFDMNIPARIRYALKKLCRGDYIRQEILMKRLREQYQITSYDALDHVNYYDEDLVIYTEYHMIEQSIAQWFRKLSQTQGYAHLLNFPRLDHLNSEQLQALTGCMKSAISVITGGPGTGKSQLIGTLLTCLAGRIEVIVLTPTGVAAETINVRFNHRAYTIHRFDHAELDPSSSRRRLVIIDEFSMVDIFMMNKVMKRLAEHDINLVLIGDPNQLPSIKAGKLLEDVLSLPIPAFKLTTCYRSNIEIRSLLDTMLLSKTFRPSKQSVIQFSYDGPDSLRTMAPDLYTHFSRRDVAILSPTNRIVDQINATIQRCNPGDILYQRHSHFKRNDKVMFLKNSSRDGLFNGTILYISNVVTAVTHDKVTFTFSDKRIFSCLGREVHSYIKLSYAMTIHKSQSAEFDEVYLILDEYPRMMFDIRLLYTAISRAKNKCYFSGDVETISRSCCFKKVKTSSIQRLF